MKILQLVVLENQYRISRLLFLRNSEILQQRRKETRNKTT